MSETKVRMLYSIAGEIAGRDFSAQAQQVCLIDSRQAKAWVKSGHAEAVSQDTPLGVPDEFRDLGLEELLNRPCRWCDRRSTHALGNFGYCKGHFNAQFAADCSSEV